MTVTENFELKVTDPVKVGDGMGSYVVYHVTFTGCAGSFIRDKLDVIRRFSDFLGLHAKIFNRHSPHGIVVPPAPSKNLLDYTKLKMSKDSLQQTMFFERRRLALERFLLRLFSHPVLRSDPDLHEFLDSQGPLPKSVDTQLLSGSSAKKMLKNFGDALGKMAYKMEEPDEWFDHKADELDCWEKQLKPFQEALSAFASSTQALSSAEYNLSRAVSQLSNVEEQTGLAQALIRLSETEDEVAHCHSNIAELELIHLVSWVNDLLGIIQACKDALGARVKAFRTWQSTEAQIRSKREQRVRLELSGRSDPAKFTQLDSQIGELQGKAETDKEHFMDVSSVIKKEFARVDFSRFQDFKLSAEQFLEALLKTQRDLLRTWESCYTRIKSLG